MTAHLALRAQTRVGFLTVAEGVRILRSFPTKKSWCKRKRRLHGPQWLSHGRKSFVSYLGHSTFEESWVLPRYYIASCMDLCARCKCTFGKDPSLVDPVIRPSLRLFADPWPNEGGTYPPWLYSRGLTKSRDWSCKAPEVAPGHSWPQSTMAYFQKVCAPHGCITNRWSRTPPWVPPPSQLALMVPSSFGGLFMDTLWMAVTSRRTAEGHFSLVDTKTGPSYCDCVAPPGTHLHQQKGQTFLGSSQPWSPHRWQRADKKGHPTSQKNWNEATMCRLPTFQIFPKMDA